MGLSMGVQYTTVKDTERGHITKCVAERRYCKFPHRLKKEAFSLLIETMAFPLKDFRSNRHDPSSVYWWTDAQFLPNDDTTLFVTGGVFEPRINQPWLVPARIPNGRIMKLELDKGEKLGGEIFSNTKMANYPKLQMHPSGNYIGFIGPDAIKIETIKHEEVFNKHKDLRMCNYRYIAFAPNGKLMAILMSCSRQFELMISMVDQGFTFHDRVVDLSRMFPGFRGNHYNEHVECKWSPDSEYIAVCSSVKFMFVLSKSLESVVNITTDVIPSGIYPSWASAFDFNPRSSHQVLAVGTNDRCLYFVNVQSKDIIQQSEQLSKDAIDCIQFHPFGKYVAVGTRNFHIYFVEPYDGAVLHHLDMHVECPDMTQRFTGVPNLIRLSFSTTGDELVTATCDGKARVYQMPQDVSLVDLCKWTILSYVPQTQLKKLPLPKQIISKLLALPNMT